MTEQAARPRDHARAGARGPTSPGPFDEPTSAADRSIRVHTRFGDVVSTLVRLDDMVEGRTMTAPERHFFYCGDSTALTVSWDPRDAATVLHLCGDDVQPWTDRLVRTLSRRLDCPATASQPGTAVPAAAGRTGDHPRA